MRFDHLDTDKFETLYVLTITQVTRNIFNDLYQVIYLQTATSSLDNHLTRNLDNDLTSATMSSSFNITRGIKSITIFELLR